MDIVAKVPHFDEGLIKRLELENVRVYRPKTPGSKLSVYLARDTSLRHIGPKAQVFRLPEALGADEYFFDLQIATTEHKLYGAPTTHAVVVCGPGGNPLQPFRIPAGRYPQWPHAYYCLSHKAVTVTAYDREDHGVIIRKHWIEADGDLVWICTDDLWWGEAESLPIKLWYYTASVKAAYEKAFCPNCTHVHYFQYRDNTQAAVVPARFLPENIEIQTPTLLRV